MFEKFGEFDSCEEINRAAAAQLKEGDIEAVIVLAQENGIDPEDAQDYIDGCTTELATPVMAALGKLKVEAEDLQLMGILLDWKDMVVDQCMTAEELPEAVRRKGKSLQGMMAELLRFSFENKVQVSDKIVKATKITHNGKVQPMRGPVYMGFPNRKQVKKMILEYYLEEKS